MKKTNQLKRMLALFLCTIGCLALLAGCVAAKAEPIEETKPEQSAEAEQSVVPEPEASEPVSEEPAESSEEGFAWDVKPFDWDAVISRDQSGVAAELAIQASYHMYTFSNAITIWFSEPDTLTWVVVDIPPVDYDGYRSEPNPLPASERLAHILEFLEERDRRYAYVDIEGTSYQMVAPISFNEIHELSEFGGYIFRSTNAPNRENSSWLNYEGPYTIIFG